MTFSPTRKLSVYRRLASAERVEVGTLAVAKTTIEAAWVDESLRRLNVYQRGEMPAYSLEEVIADLEGRAAEV